MCFEDQRTAKRWAEIPLSWHVRASPLGDFHLSLRDRRELGSALFTEESKSQKHESVFFLLFTKTLNSNSHSVKLKPITVEYLWAAASKFQYIYCHKVCISTFLGKVAKQESWHQEIEIENRNFKFVWLTGLCESVLKVWEQLLVGFYLAAVVIKICKWAVLHKWFMCTCNCPFKTYCMVR